MTDRHAGAADQVIIALAQVNPTVGDVAANAERVRVARAEAAGRGAHLVVFPELVISGYPPEDLVLRNAFLDVVQAAVLALAAETADDGPALLVGAPWRFTDPGDGRPKLGNAALLLDQGEVHFVGFKYLLPNYGVFRRGAGVLARAAAGCVTVQGLRLGIMVCEDMWAPQVAAIWPRRAPICWWF